MNRSFLIAGALAWSGIAAAMLTVSREPTPVMAKAEFAAFGERWDEELPAPLLAKADRLVVPVAQTERVVAKIEPVALVKVKQTETKRKLSMREGPCVKGKRWTVRRGGWKSWRCRR